MHSPVIQNAESEAENSSSTISSALLKHGGRDTGENKIPWQTKETNNAQAGLQGC